MRKVEKLEDLEAWRQARALVKLVYRLTKKLPREEAYNIVSQMQRATCSVAANIAEGYGRYHFKESKLFYLKARGSLEEVKSFTYICHDQNYIDKVSLDFMLDKYLNELKLINGLIRMVKRYISK